MDPITAGALVVTGLVLIFGGGGCDEYNPPDYDGYNPTDGGDVHEDGIDADFGEVEGGDDADTEGLDGDGDGGDVPDCSTPRTALGINDSYANTEFAYIPCDHKDMQIWGDSLVGACGYPLNKVFACQIQSEDTPTFPSFMVSTNCDTAFNLEPIGEFPDGSSGENHPRGLLNLNDGRVALLYDTVGDYYQTSVSVRLETSFENAQPDFALPYAMEVNSGSDVVTVLTAGAKGMAFLQSNLFIITENFDDVEAVYRRGTLISVRPESITDTDFDPTDLGAIFTNGRNPSAIAAIDNHTLAVLNAHGTDSEIPSEASAVELELACRDDLRARNLCEQPYATLDIIDVTEPANAVMVRTIEIGDVKLQSLPNLPITEDGQTAVVGSVNVPPTIYAVPVDGTTAVRSVTLPATATGEIASIALTTGTPELALVSLTSGQLFEINLSTMAVAGEETYLGVRAGASVFNPDGVLYSGVRGPWCGPADDSRIIAVDPY